MGRRRFFHKAAMRHYGRSGRASPGSDSKSQSCRTSHGSARKQVRAYHDGFRKPIVHLAMLKTTDMIIAIGASTGGTEALRVILKVLPPDTLSIIITQPMPERFTKHFADRLNQEFESKKPKRGDSAIPGQAIIAPGSDQLRRSGAQWHVHINQVPPVNRHRPSMNVMFRSVAHSAGSHSLGVLLTVMGNDGALGPARK